MKNNLFLTLLLIGFFGYSQDLESGSYISVFSQSNFNVIIDEEKIEIKTCQNIKPGSEALTSNLSYLKSDDGKYYWKGEKNPKLVLEYHPTTQKFSYRNPYNFNEEFEIYLMQKKGDKVSNGVKTYRDETEGGYSSARYLVENSASLADMDCLIHTVQSSDYNDWIIGSYIENPNGIKATLNSDFTGSLNEHPFTWSIVSNNQGKVLKVDNEYVLFLSIIVEYTDSTPFWIDPAPGKKIGQIYSVKAIKNDHKVIFGLAAEKQ
jgi:hypothetical protein